MSGKQKCAPYRPPSFVMNPDYRRCTVLAPLSHSINWMLMRGQAVKEGDLIAKVHAMTTVTVEMAVPEKEIADVRLAAPVILKARAYPERHFEESYAIAPIATEPLDARTERTVRVTTQLANADLLLKPEMTGHAKILWGAAQVNCSNHSPICPVYQN